ncbi:MAG: hypothetical protein LAT82_02420 [Nanoarchaeota archaeon]|nr:hypothetical protein [Nanoarchaeota archaeon]
MAFDLKEYKFPPALSSFQSNNLSTLEERINARTNNTEKLRKNSLKHYAQDSMFEIFREDGKVISTQRKFIQLPNMFFNFIEVFPNTYALFTHSRQTLPYVFSNENGKFRTLVSPESTGYSRQHIEESFRTSTCPKLYWLHREFN